MNLHPMFSAWLALGLLFIVNSVAFILITAAVGYNCSTSKVIRFCLSVIATNVFILALIFSALS